MIYCNLNVAKLLLLEFTSDRLKGRWLDCDWEIVEDSEREGIRTIRVKVTKGLVSDVATIRTKQRQSSSAERIAQLCVASFTLLQIQKKYQAYDDLLSH